MEDRKWDFVSERKPDIIVINLGTNDDSYVQQDETKRQAFLKAYVSFLEKVHSLKYAVRLTSQDPEINGYGADYHPSPVSHEIAACELSEFIRSTCILPVR